MKYTMRKMNHAQVSRKNIHVDHEVEAVKADFDLFLADYRKESRDKYIMSHKPLLEKLNPSFVDMTTEKGMALVMYADTLKFVDVRHMPYAEITKQLMATAS